MIPISIEQVKPCLDFFPLFPGRDTEAMRAAKQLFVPHVFADLGEDGLRGVRKHIFRYIEFMSQVRAKKNLPVKGYADRDIAAITAAVGGTEKSTVEFLRRLAADGYIYQHPRPDKSMILVIRDAAGCQKLKDIIRADTEKAEAAKAAVAARKLRLAETAARNAARRAQAQVEREFKRAAKQAGFAPTASQAVLQADEIKPSDSSFSFAGSAKISCGKAQKKLPISQKALGFTPTEIGAKPTCFGAVVSKNGSLLFFSLNLKIKSSSSSYSLRPCVDSGSQAEEDDDDFASLFASLFAEEQDQELPSGFQDSDAPVVDDPFGDDAVPGIKAKVPVVKPAEVPVVKPTEVPVFKAAAALMDDPEDLEPPLSPARELSPADEAYEAVVQSCIEEFCSDQFRPAAMRKALGKALKGASAATATRLCLESLETINDLIDQGKEIGEKWSYLRTTITNAAVAAKKAHDKAPKIHLAPAKPQAAMTQAMWDQVDMRLKAMRESEHSQLIEETKTHLTLSQVLAGKSTVLRMAKRLLAEKMEFPVDQTWKSSEGNSSREKAPAKNPYVAATASAWEKLTSDKKSGWCYTAEKELRKTGLSGDISERVIEGRAKSLYIESLGAVSPLEVD